MRLLLLSSTVAALVALAAAGGCSTNESSGVSSGAKLPAGARSNALDHEACTESGNRVELIDVNGDGKNDLRRVFDKKSGKEICRIVDLNRDDKADLYEYFDEGGAVRRREYCYSDDGVVNAIEYFEHGKMVRREYDTTGQHRIDTWDFFDPQQPDDPKTKRPKPVKRERDTNGDGIVDQWWTWEGSKVTIAFDKNGDGKADPESQVVIGAEDGGAEAGASEGPAAAPEGGASGPLAPVDAGSAPLGPVDAGGPG